MYLHKDNKLKNEIKMSEIFFFFRYFFFTINAAV